jgi:pyruvate,water dikinase
VPHEQVAGAVVVQRMVPAAAAGVLFTADPVTGRRDHAVIEAIASLGEGLVGGAVTPERWLVDSDGDAVVTPPDASGTPLGPQRVLDPSRVAELVGWGGEPRPFSAGPRTWSGRWPPDGRAWLLQAPRDVAVPARCPSPRRGATPACACTSRSRSSPRAWWSLSRPWGSPSSVRRPPAGPGSGGRARFRAPRGGERDPRSAPPWFGVSLGRPYMDITAILQRPQLRDRTFARLSWKDPAAAPPWASGSSAPRSGRRPARRRVPRTRLRRRRRRPRAAVRPRRPPAGWPRPPRTPWRRPRRVRRARLERLPRGGSARRSAGKRR